MPDFVKIIELNDEVKTVYSLWKGFPTEIIAYQSAQVDSQIDVLRTVKNLPNK